MMHLGVISLFPEIFSKLHYGIIGRAIEQGIARVDCWNPRDWAVNAYGQIDDKPYGGGPGMVMQYEPLHKAIAFARTKLSAPCKTIYLSPQGKTIKQHDLNELAAQKHTLLFLTGRYEGVDERVITQDIDEQWSLGDFVLSGGEFAALAFIDALIRLLPGSLGDKDSAGQDSFMDGLLEYPHYTRPASINGLDVPMVLLNGNHHDISKWRRKQSLGRTWLKRPDLLQQLTLNEMDKQLLIEFKREQGSSE